ncbi:MAG TPA: ATP-dependent Clp protease proteolytic subunit [Micromonosporaceae bacterium]
MRVIDARREPYPERPEPGGPGRPFPGPEAGAGWLDERMFDRRIVLVRGRVDATMASHVASALLVLGLSAPEPIQLYLSAPDGELAAAFAIVDAIDASAAPVHAVVTSEVGGAALAVLASAQRRLALAHARVRLSEPRVGTVAGTADEVTAAAGRYLRELEEMVVRIAEVTGQPRSRVEDDLSTGRILTAGEAKEYGLIDEVVGREGAPQ